MKDIEVETKFLAEYETRKKFVLEEKREPTTAETSTLL